MNLNVGMSIFWDFSLISMLKRSIMFSNFNTGRTMKPDQSILILIPILQGARQQVDFSKMMLTNPQLFDLVVWSRKHVNYALFGIYYLRITRSPPTPLLRIFQNGGGIQRIFENSLKTLPQDRRLQRTFQKQFRFSKYLRKYCILMKK